MKILNAFQIYIIFKITVVCNMTPCSLVQVTSFLSEPAACILIELSFHFTIQGHSSTPKMEAVDPLKLS
jgi:hypothetical protein